MKRLIGAMALTAAMLAGAAQAQLAECVGEPIDIAFADVTPTLDELRNSGADVFLRVGLLNRLLCARESTIRHAAIRLALTSNDPILGERALLAALMRKNTLVIELDGGDTHNTLASSTGGSVSYPLGEKDYDNKRILGSARSSLVIEVSGLTMTLVIGSARAVLQLQSDGSLRGTYYKGSRSAPAMIRLL